MQLFQIQQIMDYLLQWCMISQDDIKIFSPIRLHDRTFDFTGVRITVSHINMADHQQLLEGKAKPQVNLTNHTKWKYLFVLTLSMSFPKFLLADSRASVVS